MTNEHLYRESVIPIFHSVSIIIFAFLLASFNEYLFAQNASPISTNNSLNNQAIEDCLLTLKNNPTKESSNEKPFFIKLLIFIPCAIIVSIVSFLLGPIIFPIEIIIFIYTLFTPDTQLYIPILGKYILLWDAL